MVTADFNRGNPGVILETALAKTERHGNWEKASLARRTGPDLKD